MNRRVIQFSVMLAVTGGFTAVAQAAWGTLADAYKCEKELGVSDNQKDSAEHWVRAQQKSGTGLSDECKAEAEKRVPSCLADNSMQYALRDPDIVHGDPKGLCFNRAVLEMFEQMTNDRHDKQREVDLAKEKEESKAKAAAAAAAAAASAELPKALMHNAALESAVAKAYAKDYAPGKVLKVILGRWADEYEKDAFGRITGRDLNATVVNKQPDGSCQMHDELWLQHGKGKSFSGPFSPRGAGSAEDKPILCSKVGAKK